MTPMRLVKTIQTIIWTSALLFSSNSARAVTLCQGSVSTRLAPAVPNPGTLYFQYNTTLLSGVKYRLEANTLPTVSYFNITAYLNGVQIGNINDYEIKTSQGANFFPIPGLSALTAMGTSSAYSVTVGESISGANAISLPSGSAGKQLEIFLRFYPPLSKVVIPTITQLDAKGFPMDCAKNETAYFTSADIPKPPATVLSNSELGFFKVGGDGLYPDTNGYLFAQMDADSIAFVAFPMPKYPSCIGAGCILNRVDKPAYSSIQIASSATTQSIDGLSDRELKPSSDGFVYLAFVPKSMASVMSQLGYQIENSLPSIKQMIVYRQKLPPPTYVDSIARVPFAPAKPESIQSCVAANFIAASPVGTVCPFSKYDSTATLDTLSSCIKNSKTKLQELVNDYKKLRAAGSISPDSCH